MIAAALAFAFASENPEVLGRHWEVQEVGNLQEVEGEDLEVPLGLEVLLSTQEEVGEVAALDLTCLIVEEIERSGVNDRKRKNGDDNIDDVGRVVVKSTR